MAEAIALSIQNVELQYLKVLYREHSVIGYSQGQFYEYLFRSCQENTLWLATASVSTMSIYSGPVLRTLSDCLQPVSVLWVSIQVLSREHSLIGYSQDQFYEYLFRSCLENTLWLARLQPESVLFVSVQVLSREHSVIGYSQGQFYVRDLGSSNGTFINGTRIRQAVLSSHFVFYVYRRLRS